MNDFEIFKNNKGCLCIEFMSAQGTSLVALWKLNYGECLKTLSVVMSPDLSKRMQGFRK